MLDISKYKLIIIIISCYFLVTISPRVVAKHSFQQNKTNNSSQFQDIEKNVINQTSIEHLITLDYYFFSYDVIDHKTLLVKFDLTRTIHFQQKQILYDAYLYISKLPATNYKINIGLFSGLYEKELDGTIIDHFTFCLVLIPNRNNKIKSIFHKYLRSSYQKQQHILHYCTKMGPDENRYHIKKKQGSEGDRILLLLQVMMIGIFLVIIQIAHIIKDRKYKGHCRRQIERIPYECSSRKGYSNLSDDVLEKLRLTTINNDESQQEEEDDDGLTLSYRRLSAPITKRERSRLPSPSIHSANNTNNDTNDSSIEHILESKPWLQIPQ